ncbi:MAG TPA: hypothetical protein VHH12_12590 [Mycobacterium sp.]|nr:hypothetical protein [Mycobacterium sp.]
MTISALMVLFFGWSSAPALANAQPPQPAPSPPGPVTSTSDELADMVMDVIEQSSPATTTPAPPP